MKAVLLTTAGVLLLLLGSCGGSAAPVQPDEEQPQEQTQPTETPGELPAPVGPEPETPAEPPTSVMYDGASAPVELPLFDPRLYEPNDKQIPDILLIGVAEGQTVHDDVLISATAIDDTGVNFLALLIDGEVRTETELASLTYIWDTTDVEDGAHLMEFVVRDNGNLIGVMTLHIKVDNASDWDPPALTVSVPHCYYDETEYVPNPEYSDRSKRYSWNVAGLVDIEIVAEDPSGVRRISAYHGWSTPAEGSEDLLLGHASGGSLKLTVDTRSEYLRTCLVIAEDNCGNVAQSRHYFRTNNAVAVGGWFTDMAGNSLDGVLFYLMPRDWDDSMEFDPQLATAMDESRSSGYVGLTAITGRNWFVAVYEEQVKFLYVATTPDPTSGYLPEELTRFE